MTRFITAFAAIATLAAAPAFASDTPKKSTKDPMEKRVCVVKATTGSILDKKECRTRGEWIALTGTDPLQKKQ